MSDIPDPSALERESLSASLRHEEIALRAYRLYVSRGYLDGFDVQDWLQAEQEVLGQLDGEAQVSRTAIA